MCNKLYMKLEKTCGKNHIFWHCYQLFQTILNRMPTSMATKILFMLVAYIAHKPHMVMFVMSFMVQVTSYLAGVKSWSLNWHEFVPTVTSVKLVWECGQCLHYAQELQDFLNQVLHFVIYLLCTLKQNDDYRTFIIMGKWSWPILGFKSQHLSKRVCGKHKNHSLGKDLNTWHTEHKVRFLTIQPVSLSYCF